MSQQSLFIADGGGSNNTANVTAQNTADGGFSLQGLVAQYNVTPPTLTDTFLTFLQTDAYGALKISGTVSNTDMDAANPGSAVPTQTSWIGASDGTNLRGLLVESASRANLRTSLYYGATEMIIGLDGYTAVHQADSPWVVSGTVTANQGGAWTVAATQSGSWTVAATQSGTWTVQQGTPPWSFVGTYASNVAPGSDAVKSLVARYQSSPSAVTDGNLTYLQTDAYGVLKVSFPAGADNDAANPGSALPSQTSWIGASDGTNLQGLRVDDATNKNLRVALFNGSNELAIDASGFATVNQGTSPWVISGTVTANQGGAWTVAATQSGTWTVQQGTPPWSFVGTYAPNVAAGTDADKSLTAQFNATGAATAVSGPVDGYRFADVAVTNGNVTYAQTDGYGRLEMTGATAIAYAYENRINQTITLKNTAGVLRKVIVGNAGKTGALLTFYDNTAASGTVIAKINTSSILGQLVFDIPFAVGLTYTTNAPSPAADVTITFE